MSLKVPNQQLSEHAQSLARAAGLILIVFAVGVIGFKVVGGEENTFIDAMFMTAITLTTVGYAETINVSATPQGAIFTTVLLFAGVGSFVYFFSNLTAFMVEGSLDQLLWRRKMKRAIENLNEHYIVCGGGATGEHIIRELLQTERPFVLIESEEARMRELFERLAVEFPVVIGDATDDDALKEAGIDRARGLTACISNDKDNLIVTVSAKLLNKNLRIVSRCIDEKVTRKVRQAGAAAVVSPNMIGGLRMVSEMVRPTVVSFLDIMLRDQDKRLRVEEHPISEGSPIAGSTVGELRNRKIADLLVVAVSKSDGTWTYNPVDEAKLEAGMGLIFMGSPQARAELERLSGGEG
jgi:voltage-gated potassium channel